MKTSQFSVIVIVQLLNLINSPTADATGGCVFKGDNRPTQGEMVPYQRLKPLFGKSYELTDPTHPKYTYQVGICTDAVKDQNGFEGVGAVQFVKDQETSKTINTYNLGFYTNAKIITGSDWIYLEYQGGKPYGSHCTQESRRAVIMITCDETVTDSKATMLILEENNNMTNGCYYLFELSHQDICPGTKSRGSDFDSDELEQLAQSASDDDDEDDDDDDSSDDDSDEKTQQPVSKKTKPSKYQKQTAKSEQMSDDSDLDLEDVVEHFAMSDSDSE